MKLKGRRIGCFFNDKQIFQVKDLNFHKNITIGDISDRVSLYYRGICPFSLEEKGPKEARFP